MKDKSIYVAFANSKLENDFEKLQKGKFEDKQLYMFIERAMEDLKKNPTCGTKIPKRLWPKGYVKEYQITNLWKLITIYSFIMENYPPLPNHT